MKRIVLHNLYFTTLQTLGRVGSSPTSLLPSSPNHACFLVGLQKTPLRNLTDVYAYLPVSFKSTYTKNNFGNTNLGVPKIG